MTKRQKPLEITGRLDGRPEAYDMPPDFRGGVCITCMMEDKIGVRYNHGEIFLCSPLDASDGQSHLVCKGHVPEDVVIFDPVSGTCRNKSGSEVWKET